MAKVLTPEQGDQIVPRETRRRVCVAERKAAELAAREQAALSALTDLGAQIALYEPSQHVEADELRGTEARFVPGVCNVVFICATDALKRKSVSGISAVNALDEVNAWLRYQERLKPEFRFQIAREPVAPNICQRVSGDTATTAARRENTQRRLLAFESGRATEVDASGEPINGNVTQASQYS